MESVLMQRAGAMNLLSFLMNDMTEEKNSSQKEEQAKNSGWKKINKKFVTSKFTKGYTLMNFESKIKTLTEGGEIYVELDNILAEFEDFEKKQLNRYWQLSKVEKFNKYCFLATIQGSYEKYKESSIKKVDYFHLFVQDEINYLFRNSNEYEAVMEYPVESINPSGKKNCDIVIRHRMKGKDSIKVIFPVKMPMTSYGSAWIGSFENLLGEVQNLRWACPNYKIVPINIWIHKSPKLEKGKITSFEITEYKNIKHYEELKTMKFNENDKNYVIDDFIGYIVDIEDIKDIKRGVWDKNIVVKDFYQETNYKSIRDIVQELFDEII